jgi:DNA-binding response OmpR family regulator
VTDERILIVEDGQCVGSTLGRALAADGYQARWEQTRRGAIELP